MPTGVYPRQPHSAETRRKIAEKLRGNTNGRFRAGVPHSDESKAKMSAARFGKKIGPRKSLIGVPHSYMAAHIWMRRHFQKQSKCECCGVLALTPRHTHWANISGKCLRDRADFWELCVRCHKIFDYLKIIRAADAVLLERLNAKLA